MGRRSGPENGLRTHNKGNDNKQQDRITKVEERERMTKSKDKGKGRYQIGWYRATNAWLGHTNDVGRRRRDEIRMGRAYGGRLVEDVLVMERIETPKCCASIVIII